MQSIRARAYAILSDPAKPAALALVRVRRRAQGEKLAPRRRRPGHGRRGSLEAWGPLMVSTSGPTIWCEDGCPVVDVCYARAQGWVKKDNRTAALANGITSIDITHAMIWELQRMQRIGEGGGRDGTTGLDVRINVAGDVIDPVEAAMWAMLAEEWDRAGGGKVWGFTRFWRGIPRSAWGLVSIVASVTEAEVPEALAAGYDVALVDDDATACRARLRSSGGALKVYSCPYQESKRRGRFEPVTCVQCRVCVDGRKQPFAVVFKTETRGAGNDDAVLRRPDVVQLRAPRVRNRIVLVARRVGDRTGIDVETLRIPVPAGEQPEVRAGRDASAWRGVDQSREARSFEPAAKRRIPSVRGRNAKNVLLVHAGGCRQVGAAHVDAVGVHRCEEWLCADGCPVRSLDEREGRAVAHTFEQLASAGQDEYLRRLVGPGGRVLTEIGPGTFDREGLVAVVADSDGESLLVAAASIRENGGEVIEEVLLVQSWAGTHYAPRPSPRERDAGLSRTQPLRAGRVELARNPLQCVKPLAVVRALVTELPPGPVLDPFAGTGTTGIACLREDRASVCIEKDRTHSAVAYRRRDLEDRSSACAWKVGDCVDVMPTIRARSFAGVVTDPPYGCTPNPWDDREAALDPKIWTEVFRLLRRGGELRMFAWGPALAPFIDALRQAGFVDIAVRAWVFGNGTSPTTSSRLRRTWQPILSARKAG